MNGHCADNKGDRATGEHWERQFCTMAARLGKVFTPHQIGKPGVAASAYGMEGGEWRQWLLPDVTVWSAPGEHHEIKHKNTTRDGCYGLEEYRLASLVRFANTTGQQVLYTIHDWQRAGCRSSREPCENRLQDWVFADIADLSRATAGVSSRRSPSYVNGERREVAVRYWSAAVHFRPLAMLWLPPSVVENAS